MSESYVCPPQLAGVLMRLGLQPRIPAVCIGGDSEVGNGPLLTVRSPIDGSRLAEFPIADRSATESAVSAASDAFSVWRSIPAPRRGEFVRLVGERLRQHQEDLAELVTWEVGKIRQEALGEVQEMIDICDFAVGLSRQLYGVTMGSERPRHRLSEYWHPLGPVAVISAFNFPVAVWAWNAAIAWVCGDPVIWKPSEKAPLCALACHALVVQVQREQGWVPPGIASVVIGTGADVGQTLAAHPSVPLVSATGSVEMGRAVGKTVAARLGRSLLELGGNNGMIVAPSADLELATRAIVFAAVGTCGQRCTSLRRLFVHNSIADQLIKRLKSVYEQLPIGNPLDEGVLVGPLIDDSAAQTMAAALENAEREGGTVWGGGILEHDVPAGGSYVRPALVEIPHQAAIVQTETFAPILYIMRYEQLDEVIDRHNAVPQGLASSIFTNDIREAEMFTGPAGSDCGIVNVNIGPSGAEIGGAFGGEKQTGGGRESGSDSWKAYMRRVTTTVNYSTELPLAQGIEFNL